MGSSDCKHRQLLSPWCSLREFGVHLSLCVQLPTLSRTWAARLISWHKHVQLDFVSRGFLYPLLSGMFVCMKHCYTQSMWSGKVCVYGLCILCCNRCITWGVWWCLFLPGIFPISLTCLHLVPALTSNYFWAGIENFKSSHWSLQLISARTIGYYMSLILPAYPGFCIAIPCI